MKIVNNYIGIEPSGVLVDDSKILKDLVEEARKLKELSFPEKLESVKKLTLEAMVNAYEQMIKCKNENALEEYKKYRKIIFEKNPLSYALEQKAGCCRYQAVLFFILGYEAELGDKHFIQIAPVNESVLTVFNEIIYEGKSYTISIFTESLENKSLDYSKQNPKIFEEKIKEEIGRKFYSYHKTLDGFVIVENLDKHVEELENK
ncbi:MAG: hypothetical protein QXU20_02890 [Candidatus Woesearchaeota archaeon]